MLAQMKQFLAKHDAFSALFLTFLVGALPLMTIWAMTFEEEQAAKAALAADAKQKAASFYASEDNLHGLDVAVVADHAKVYHDARAGLLITQGDVPEVSGRVKLEHVSLAIDVDNTSLQEVIDLIIAEAADKTGPWKVKWRLKPENVGLKKERINLIAEAKFGEFMKMLTERVRNLSGVQLYTSVFETSRIVVISDTYG